jgi:hypothetical protein
MPPAASPRVVPTGLIVSPQGRRYTRAVPAQQIASNLAYINWTVLTGLAVGAYGVALLTRWRTAATPGFVRFTTICALAFGVLAWFSDGALPGSLGESPVVANADFDVPRRAALALFVVLGAIDLIALRNRPIGRYVGSAALGAGVLVLVFGALAWGSGSSVGLLLQLAVLSAATGGVFAAMILGHWYLVTPKLSPLPLRRMMWLLIGALVLQGLAFVLAIALVGTDPLEGDIGWLTWLRLAVGIVLPIGVAVLAILASRASSLQASTGLLYIGLALIMAGSIAGASLTYLTGVPV